MHTYLLPLLELYLYKFGGDYNHKSWFTLHELVIFVFFF